MCVGKTIWIAPLCLVMVLSSTAFGQGLWVTIEGTADERADTGPDYFGVMFECDNDVRITQIIYDLSFASADLFFDVAPHDGPGYDFTIQPESSDVGATHLSADNSHHLVINFTDFEPGEYLYFAIDVDGVDNSTFSPEDFAGALMGVVIDPSGTFPEALPQGLVFTFEAYDQFGIEAITTGTDEVPIPEPATGVLFITGLAALGGFVKRRAARASRAVTRKRR